MLVKRLGRGRLRKKVDAFPTMMSTKYKAHPYSVRIYKKDKCNISLGRP